MIKTIVTKREYHKAKEVFDNQHDFEIIPCEADEKILSSKIQSENSKYVIVGVDKYKNQLYDALPEGGVIARFGVGHDGVDKILATKKGIYCTNTPNVLDESVAEYTISLITLAARKLMNGIMSLKDGKWNPHVGKELKGKKLVIIGCGNIGQKVAKIASYGFQMEVTGCDFDLKSKLDYRALGFHSVTADFVAAVKDADYISLHIPGSKSTFNYIGKTRLSQMPSTSVLINTARGQVVDENALYEVASDDGIAGAVLDVFHNEPYLPLDDSKDLRKLKNIIMLPHMGSSTREACDKMALLALDNIRKAEKGDIKNMNLLSTK